MTTTPRFALIGAAGFVAPRHLQAIKDVGGKLVAALDPHDAVGVLDRFDKETEFFTEEHAFERYLERLRQDDSPVDWVVVCSPNYLHFTHVRLGLWAGAKVLCEKPLVVNPDNLDRLEDIESSFIEHANERRVFTVLQLRHVEALKKLRARSQSGELASPRVMLDYKTPRGRWYDRSWKGDTSKSGGLGMNIGIHMFDLMLWLFGPVADHRYLLTPRAHHRAGRLTLARATVDYVLSIDPTQGGPSRKMYLDPDNSGKVTETIEFEGFENLHTTVYRETLAGRGHTIADARPAVELAALLRR